MERCFLSNHRQDIMASSRTPKTAAQAAQYVNPEVLQAYLSGVQNDVTDIKGTLIKLTEAVAGIERLETRQLALISDIESTRDVQSHLGERISKIEQLLPGLIELRKWVVGGMVAGVGMLLIAVASLVLYPRNYVVLSSASLPAPFAASVATPPSAAATLPQ
jgi:hypothetical protein